MERRSFHIASAVVSSVMLISSFFACTPENFRKEVKFSVSTTSTPITKTAYGEATANYQFIDWSAGDSIYVRCPQCYPSTETYYRVSTSGHSGSKTNASISSLSPLYWGEGTHTFYAVYPPLTVYNADKSSLSISGGHMVYSGEIAMIQTPSGAIVSGVVNPDMSNQLLLARTQVAEKASSVSVDFYPYSTAVEFTITNGFESNRTMLLKSVTLQSDSHIISGRFSVDLDDTAGINGRCKCTAMTSSSLYRRVMLDLNGYNATIAKSGSLTFTFFLNPSTGSGGIDDLTINLIYNYVGGTDSDISRSAKLEGKTFQTHKKTPVTGIMLPEYVQWEIEGDVFISSWEDGGNTDLTLQ